MVFHWSLSDSTSPGFFSVFWPSSIILSIGWSPLVCQLPNPPGPLIIILSLYQKKQSQLVQSSLSCSIVSSILKQGRGTYPSFNIPSILFCGQPRQQSRQFCKFSFLVDYYEVWSSGRDEVIRVSHRILCVSFSRTCAGLCISTCWYGQILISCTFPCG